LADDELQSGDDEEGRQDPQLPEDAQSAALPTVSHCRSGSIFERFLPEYIKQINSTQHAQALLCYGLSSSYYSKVL
jgi:hypothetical protein